MYRLEVLAKQLAATLMTAVLCTREIGDMVRADPDGAVPTGPRHPHAGLHPEHSGNRQRPLLDESTLSVIWKGKTLHLGPTHSFKVLARLARRPGHYVTQLDLVRDVWDREDLPTATIRSEVRRLRAKLQSGGMEDLAAAIEGHNGHYILNL